MSIWLGLAAVSGFLVVALGAFGAHGLREVLDSRGQDLWQKAVLYQMFHTLALLTLGLVSVPRGGWHWAVTGWAFVAGIVVFSGSLYALALGAPNWWGAITPLGGASFLLGWAGLAWGGLRGR